MFVCTSFHISSPFIVVVVIPKSYDVPDLSNHMLTLVNAILAITLTCCLHIFESVEKKAVLYMRKVAIKDSQSLFRFF